MKLDVLSTPLNVVVSAVPINFRHEVIQLQTDEKLKAMYLSMPLAGFDIRYVNADYIIIIYPPCGSML